MTTKNMNAFPFEIVPQPQLPIAAPQSITYLDTEDIVYVITINNDKIEIEMRPLEKQLQPIMVLKPKPAAK